MNATRSFPCLPLMNFCVSLTPLFGLFEESRARCLLIVADSPLMRELYRGYVRAAYAKNYNMKRNQHVACSTHLIITNYTE
jgi:hypothetical protein